jgi:fluoroacetyl-CoA thioesterase
MNGVSSGSPPAERAGQRAACENRFREKSMPDFQIGAKREDLVEIGHDQAIQFLGAEARVLSTPQMILFMERTCRNLILGMLEPGHDTVGTHVNVRHLAAAPMGSQVTFTAELVSVDNRRAEFKVEARMGDKVIGDGTHQRVVIEVARFTEKVKGAS